MKASARLVYRSHPPINSIRFPPRRSASANADQVRTRDKSQDREGKKYNGALAVTRTRRRGDRELVRAQIVRRSEMA
jgi:hypothetical protein